MRLIVQEFNPGQHRRVEEKVTVLVSEKVGLEVKRQKEIMVGCGDWADLQESSDTIIQLTVKTHSRIGSVSIPTQMLLEYHEDCRQNNQFSQWMMLYTDPDEDMFDGELAVHEKLQGRMGIMAGFLFADQDIDDYEIEELSCSNIQPSHPPPRYTSHPNQPPQDITLDQFLTNQQVIFHNNHRTENNSYNSKDFPRYTMNSVNSQGQLPVQQEEPPLDDEYYISRWNQQMDNEQQYKLQIQVKILQDQYQQLEKAHKELLAGQEQEEEEKRQAEQVEEHRYASQERQVQSVVQSLEKEKEEHCLTRQDYNRAQESLQELTSRHRLLQQQAHEQQERLDAQVQEEQNSLLDHQAQNIHQLERDALAQEYKVNQARLAQEQLQSSLEESGKKNEELNRELKSVREELGESLSKIQVVKRAQLQMEDEGQEKLKQLQEKHLQQMVSKEQETFQKLEEKLKTSLEDKSLLEEKIEKSQKAWQDMYSSFAQQQVKNSQSQVAYLSEQLECLQKDYDSIKSQAMEGRRSNQEKQAIIDQYEAEYQSMQVKVQGALNTQKEKDNTISHLQSQLQQQSSLNQQLIQDTMLYQRTMKEQQLLTTQSTSQYKVKTGGSYLDTAQRNEIDCMLEQFFSKQSVGSMPSLSSNQYQIKKDPFSNHSSYSIQNRKVELAINQKKQLVVKVGAGFMELSEFMQMFNQSTQNESSSRDSHYGTQNTLKKKRQANQLI